MYATDDVIDRPPIFKQRLLAGRKIQVRLRRGTDNSFYEFNHVLGTLLHELVHIEISAHSAAFYKMLDVLWEEVRSHLHAAAAAASICKHAHVCIPFVVEH